VLIIDRDSVQQALISSFNETEDALQNFSAGSNGNIEVIITRNVKDDKNSTLAVMTPENYLRNY